MLLWPLSSRLRANRAPALVLVIWLPLPLFGRSLDDNLLLGESLFGRADDPRSRPPRRSRARVRTASTCSRRCQEAHSMGDKLVISTRKGLFTVARRAAGQWEIEGVDFLGDNVSLTLTDPRDGRTYPRSTTDILASNYTARPRTAGKRFRPPPIRLSPRAMRSTTCGAVRSTGARRASGRWRRAAPTSPG